MHIYDAGDDGLSDACAKSVRDVRYKLHQWVLYVRQSDRGFHLRAGVLPESPVEDYLFDLFHAC